MAQRGPPIDARVKDYLSAETKEDIVARFINQLPEDRLLVFKYLPSVRSLAITHAPNYQVGQLEGVGCQLTTEEAKDFGKQVVLGIIPPSLQNLLTAAFRMEEGRLLPLFVLGKLELLVAYSGKMNVGYRERLQDEFSLMSLAYVNFALEKRLDSVEIVDPLTGALNRAAYFDRLRNEWSRARRLKQPVSLIKISLDDFPELEQALGENVRDELLKHLAQILVRTGRTNDSVCRTGMNEFAVITTHCHRQGAMIRAERLRRLVESSQMLENGLRVSISLGISEYPMLAGTAEVLDETATRALEHIAGKGGNRLCLFKAPPEHVPDFPVDAGSET